MLLDPADDHRAIRIADFFAITPMVYVRCSRRERCEKNSAGNSARAPQPECVGLYVQESNAAADELFSAADTVPGVRLRCSAIVFRGNAFRPAGTRLGLIGGLHRCLDVTSRILPTLPCGSLQRPAVDSHDRRPARSGRGGTILKTVPFSLRLRGTLRKYAHQPVLAAPQNNHYFFCLKLTFCLTRDAPHLRSFQL